MKKLFALIFAICLTNNYNIKALTPEQMNEMASEKWNIVEEKEYLGEFTLTFYCGCKECNGKWYGFPAKNGEELKDNYTIAVDPKVIDLNTWVEIDGYGEYKACDTGSAIKGNKIDIYVSTHEEAMNMGVIEDIKVYKVD